MAASKADQNQSLYQMEVREQSTASSDEVPPLATTEPTMNRTKWLACIALGLSYTTAFQQNACTAAIVKHIDAELGKFFLL
jgi:hypothetical protein